MKYFQKIWTIILSVALCSTSIAQVHTITFTGKDWTNQYHIPLHHVTVFNLDQLWEEVLYYPDTTLVLGTVGVDSYNVQDVQLMQNVPNPFDGITEFALVLPEGGDVQMEIYDIAGRLAVGRHFSDLQAGTHLFQTTLASPQTYLLSAKVEGGQMTIKMVNEGHGAGNTIQHLGMTNLQGDFTLYLKNDKYSGGYPFSVGDEMKYTGYALIDGGMKESNIIQCHQNNNDTYTLQFDVTAPTVTTASANSITSYSAVCGGNVTVSGGSPVVARGVCWSTSHNPTLSNSHVENGTGLGGFTCSITGLSSGTTYYVRAYATNSVGTAYGVQKAFTTEAAGPIIDEKSCSAAPTVTDHEGNVYATVQIGNQCWMRDNLRTTTSPSTGTYLVTAAGTDSTYTGKQARWYNNDSATYATMNYGLLYNWNAAVDTFKTEYGETSVNTDYNNAVSVTFSGHRRGICPAGWHLPSDAEWSQLENYVGSQSEYICGGNSSYISKALASETGWNTSTNSCAVGNNQGANNATGFSAVPASFFYGLSFGSACYVALFWSSSQHESTRRLAYYRDLHYFNADVPRYINNKYYGFSVRCLKN